MDTPDPDVVKDSQQSHPNVTPKSATFGSPLHTQESWTAPPRRRQVQQKAKASFLDEEDEQSDTHVAPNPREELDADQDLDSTSSEIDLEQDGEDKEALVVSNRDVFNQSPTLQALQGAHMPSQSAQLAPEGSLSGSSDSFSVFESLKRHRPTAVTPHNHPKIAHSQKHLQPAQTQKRTLKTGDTAEAEGERGPPTKDAGRELKVVARKTLANSKVKLSALELEEEPDAEKPDNHKPHENDYSLPESNSSSPAATPAKKRAPAKKQAVKKPAPKPKATARQTKAANRGRPKNAKPAPAPPVRQSSDTHPDEEHEEDMLPVEEPSMITQTAHEDNPTSQINGQKLESENSSNEDQKQDVVMISSDSTSSFPEADNADDQDFECSRKMTPSVARRRTRATAARSQAAKESKGKAEKSSAPWPNARRLDAQEEKSDVDTAERPKRRPKQPPKKTAIDKTEAVTTRSEPNFESKKEAKSSGENSKKGSSTSEPRAAGNRMAKAKSEIQQETVVSSNFDRVGRGEVNKLGQKSETAKQTEHFCRKPNIVAFGPGGPKNNGRPHKTTATTDSRSQIQQPGPANGDHPAATKTQPTKGAQKAPRLQLNTTVQDGDSPTNGFIGLAKGGLSRAARASQTTVAEAVPDNTSISDADIEAIVPEFDAEMTTLVDEAPCGDASGQSAIGDFEADRVVEDPAILTVDSRDYQDLELSNASEGKGDRKVLKPPTRVDNEHRRLAEKRIVLGAVDANYQTRPKDVPAVIPRLMKRKRPDVMTVKERSPIQQALGLKTDSQSETFPSLRMDSTAFDLPSGHRTRPVKKPRYNSTHAVRANHDTEHISNLVGGTDSPFQGRGDNTGDDVFGPGKNGKFPGSSAFVQRLISNDSADRGLGEAGMVAPAAFDKPAVPRQHSSVTNHPATTRFVAPGAGSRIQKKQQPDDVRTRMLAALGPEKAQSPDRRFPIDERRKRFLVDDAANSWPTDEFDQRRASEVDERAQAWKKATEPYADSLGETMHKIVNVS